VKFFPKLGLSQSQSHCSWCAKAIRLQCLILLSQRGQEKPLAFSTSPDSRWIWKDQWVQLLIIVPFRELGDPDWAGDARDGDWIQSECGLWWSDRTKDRMEINLVSMYWLAHLERVAWSSPKRGLSRQVYWNSCPWMMFDNHVEIGFESRWTHSWFTSKSKSKNSDFCYTGRRQCQNFPTSNSQSGFDYLAEKFTQLTVKRVLSPSKDKFERWSNWSQLGNQKRDYSFCNSKIQFSCDGCFSKKWNLHGYIHGGYGAARSNDR